MNWFPVDSFLANSISRKVTLKQIKKGPKGSAGILEIIHIYFCGSFPIKFVDGFDSFITFINDFSHYGYIYPIKNDKNIR
jgi:hypothetical protein